MKKYIITFEEFTSTYHPIGDGELVGSIKTKTEIVNESDLNNFIRLHPNIKNCQQL